MTNLPKRMCKIWFQSSLTSFSALGNLYFTGMANIFARMQRARNAMTAWCHLTGVQRRQQVRAAESGHHYRRNCGLGRTEKHAVAITSGSTLLSPSPKTLFVAQTTHMAGGDSWAHESNHRLDYHSTKGAPKRVRSGIKQGVATTTCIHLLSLCAGPTIIQSKRLPFRRKKKAYVYI